MLLDCAYDKKIVFRDDIVSRCFEKMFLWYFEWPMQFESLILLKRCHETLAFPIDLFHGIIFLKSIHYIIILIKNMTF